MVDKIVKRRKVSISEDDLSTLLQRYTATTVLALLWEVARCPDVNIDWEALAKNTSTGISDAREYQMLWRHLAYRHPLLDKFEDGAQPLDDDSDLECEVEAVPIVSTDALTEAAACVKVLIASALPSDSSLPNSSLVEAPLTINIPNGPSSRAPSENPEATCSMQGMNITIPFSVQKQPLSAATPAEGLDANGPANGTLPPRRKRKPWSETEDMELISAVQKFGEGNWANIVRADFMVDRTASQLSQRWAIIRKRRGNLNVGINSTSSQLSEARRAAHHAMSLALDMPVKNFTAARPAALVKILTTDNLRKCGMVVMEWCFMFKKNGESIDHLLLHCEVARELWVGVLSSAGLSWVMSMRVVDLLACWNRRHKSS